MLYFNKKKQRAKEILLFGSLYLIKTLAYLSTKRATKEYLKNGLAISSALTSLLVRSEKKPEEAPKPQVKNQNENDVKAEEEYPLYDFSLDPDVKAEADAEVDKMLEKFYDMSGETKIFINIDTDKNGKKN